MILLSSFCQVFKFNSSCGKDERDLNCRDSVSNDPADTYRFLSLKFEGLLRINMTCDSGL